MLKYLKEEVSKSPNKYNISPKNIYIYNIRAFHLNLINKYNDIYQNIYNYIEKAREPEPKLSMK